MDNRASYNVALPSVSNTGSTISGKPSYSRTKRPQLEFYFKGIQPNIIVFYAIRGMVMKYFWEIDIHAHDTDDFSAFDVSINGEKIFTRKGSHGFPNISQVLREIYVVLSSSDPTKASVTQAQTLVPKGKGEAGRDAECKPMDLSKLDVKRWLTHSKGLLSFK